jgi:hypothetical protein
MSQYIKPVRANLTVSGKSIQCEGLGCNNKATDEIEVSAGKFGIIVLSLCKNCTSEFKHNERSVSDQDTNQRTHNPRAMSLSNGNKS